MSEMMTSRLRNYRLGPVNWSFADTVGEAFAALRTGRLSENTRKFFRRVIDTWGSFVQLAICVMAVSLDPLFLYIPVINDHEKCFQFDKNLRIAALVLRSVTDAIFVFHIAFQFRIGYVSRDSAVFHRDGVKEKVSSWGIPKTYMLSYFIIDVLSLLPVPQVIMLSIIPEMKGAKSLVGRDILVSLLLLQYVPRVVRIYPLYTQLKWTPSTFKGSLWTKAAFNLFLYMLASHVLGALWYFFSIEKEITCWQQACERNPGCVHSSFFCHEGIRAAEFLRNMCPIDTPNTNLFDFGIFLDALQSGIVESVNFPQKFFRCLWWGLQNLSSLGQNLKTSTNVWENIFAVSISTSGLVLFLYFIGKVQTYMQLITVKKEEKRKEMRYKEIAKEVAKREAKEAAVDLWMSTNVIPECIKKRIKRSLAKKWHEIGTVDSENLIRILPMALQKDIKRFLCWDLVMKVPEFRSKDYKVLDAICGCLKPVLYSPECYIIRNGDPVKEMCFIFRGTGKAITNSIHNSIELQTGDFCGEELLKWAFCVSPPVNLPVSNRTVQALIEVEAFVLTAEDLKYTISQFWQLRPQQTLRLYSQQLRTWATLVIQKAWRQFSTRCLKNRSKKRRIDRLMSFTNTRETSTTRIGDASYVSRFTANALHLIQPRKPKEAEIITAVHQHRLPGPDFPGEGSS